MHICIYTYIHIYIYTHIHIYIYIYIYNYIYTYTYTNPLNSTVLVEGTGRTPRQAVESTLLAYAVVHNILSIISSKRRCY